MGTTQYPAHPSQDGLSRPLTRTLAWALLAAPLACIGGQGDATTSASSTTASGSSASDGMTSTSGKTTSAGSGTDGTDGTQGTLGTLTQGTLTQGTLTQGTASDTDATDTDPPCNFVGCDDDVPTPEYCDYLDELCPEGSKCSFDGALSESACFDLVPMPDTIGEPCEPSDSWPGGMDSCDDELLCWEESCVPFCDAEDFSCPSGYTCSWCQDCVLGICIPQCDPLLQNCQAGDTCVPNNEDFTCVVDASGDLGAYRDPCEFVNSCDPGLVCVDAVYVPECEGASCCSPLCDLDRPMCPEESLECLPWYAEGEAPPGYEVVGLCGLPQP